MSEKGTYSDPRCCTCNPPGWREVDGVELPSVSTWAEEHTTLGEAMLAASDRNEPWYKPTKECLDRNSAKWDALNDPNSTQTVRDLNRKWERK